MLDAGRGRTELTMTIIGVISGLCGPLMALGAAALLLAGAVSAVRAVRGRRYERALYERMAGA